VCDRLDPSAWNRSLGSHLRLHIWPSHLCVLRVRTMVKMSLRINHSHGAESFLKSQSSLSQEIPRLLRNRIFIIIFTWIRHHPLSWARWIQFSSLYHIYLVSILMISSLETGWTAKVRFPAGVNDFSILHSIQTVSGAHPSNGYRREGGCFPRVKAAGVLGWSLTSI
jgi:hypothetical protein